MDLIQEPQLFLNGDENQTDGCSHHSDGNHVHTYSHSYENDDSVIVQVHRCACGDEIEKTD